MRRFLVAMLAVFALIQSVPSEAAQPVKLQGLEIKNVKGTLPGGGSFVGDILIEKFLPEGGSKLQVRVVGTILQGRLIPLRPGPQNVVVAGHVRDRTNHEHDGYG